MGIQFHSKSQNLIVNNQNGTNVGYSIAGIRNLTFTNTSLTVLLFDGSNFTYNLVDLQNYRYNQNSLNLDELFEDLKINIYPNPSHDQVIVNSELSNDKMIKYTIVDLTGKIIREKDFSLQNQVDNEIVISLEDLQAGDYMLNLYGSKITYSKKITKN
jgi:hypothetical protein